ncbi:MAG: SDR family NAD(P)-dependent oxidoreductase [Pseudomonadota bacterium]
MPTHPQGFTAFVIGATGGIGRALVEALVNDRRVVTVYAGSRAGNAAVPGALDIQIDITDETEISDAFAAIEEPLDLVIVATGILHDDAGLTPEKSYGKLDASQLAKSFAINTIGPALVAKHAAKRLPRDRRAVIAALSARVGSISDNRLGGWYGYRASKAALNQMLKCFAIEIGRKRKQAIVVGLHPGTVNTGLSEPFQANVPPGKLFSPHQSAGYLLQVIEGLTPEDSGKVFDWDGQEVPA